MEKEMKKHFLLGQGSKMYKNANICILCIFRVINQLTMTVDKRCAQVKENRLQIRQIT